MTPQRLSETRYNKLSLSSWWLLIAFLVTTTFAQEQSKEIADTAVTRAVTQELLFDEAVPAHLVDIETNEGIVTLSGSVAHLLAKERAVRLAQTIMGVRGVVDNISVRPVERSDKEIEQDVRTALAMDPAIKSYEVNTNVEDQMIVLEGEVQSWAEKQLAQKVAMSVKGAQAIRNEIRIDYPDTRPDAEIASEVRRRIELDPFLHKTLIDVTVDNGKVALSGVVGTAQQRQIANDDAWVAGVRSVSTEDLKVEWWARDEMQKKRKVAAKSDEAIREAVLDALRYDPRVNPANIEVHVNNATVSLTGTVDNLPAKQSAGNDASDAIGVTNVRNNILVRSESPTDDEIADNVASAFFRDPVIERHKIDVVVRNRKVYLYGDVDSYFEKQRADRIAAQSAGVAAISNNLSVNESHDWKGDAQIEADIEDELYWSWYIDAGDVNVQVDDGVATLEGNVDGTLEYRAAVDNAFDGGAQVVRSDISVQGQKPEGAPLVFYRENYENEYF